MSKTKKTTTSELPDVPFAHVWFGPQTRRGFVKRTSVITAGSMLSMHGWDFQAMAVTTNPGGSGGVPPSGPPPDLRKYGLKVTSCPGDLAETVVTTLGGDDYGYSGTIKRTSSQTQVKKELYIEFNEIHTVLGLPYDKTTGHLKVITIVNGPVLNKKGIEIHATAQTTMEIEIKTWHKEFGGSGWALVGTDSDSCASVIADGYAKIDPETGEDQSVSDGGPTSATPGQLKFRTPFLGSDYDPTPPGFPGKYHYYTITSTEHNYVTARINSLVAAASADMSTSSSAEQVALAVLEKLEITLSGPDVALFGSPIGEQGTWLLTTVRGYFNESGVFVEGDPPH